MAWDFAQNNWIFSLEKKLFPIVPSGAFDAAHVGISQICASRCAFTSLSHTGIFYNLEEFDIQTCVSFHLFCSFSLLWPLSKTTTMSLPLGNTGPSTTESHSTSELVNERPSTEMDPVSVTKVGNDTDYSNSTRPQSRRQHSIAELSQEAQDQIHELARRLTQASIFSDHGKSAPNPFFGSSDPALDPNSNSFEFEAWLSKLVESQRDRPTPSAGVSFRNLNVHGFGFPTDYQKDFANVLLEGPAMVQRMMGKGRTRIQILKNFDGLIKEGEMLVILGRPGR